MSLVKFARFVADPQGNVVENAEVVVSKAGGGPADIYSDPLGANPIVGSLITASDGYFEFYCAPGDYDIATTKSGFKFRTLTDLTIGSQGVVATQPINSLQTARIMWNVNRWDGTTSYVPTSVDMDRIVGTYKCNVVQYGAHPSGSGNPHDETTIGNFLDAVQNWNVKTIIDLDPTVDPSAVVSRWENDSRVVGFSAVDEGYVLTQAFLDGLHTNKPVVLSFGMVNHALLFGSVDAPLFFTWLGFWDNQIYSSTPSAYGFTNVVDPPGPGAFEFSTAMTMHASLAPAMPFIPSVTIASEQGSLQYCPSGEENAKALSYMGADASAGLIIDCWDVNTGVSASGTKNGLFPADDTDPKLKEFRALITNVSYGMGFIGGNRGTKATYESLTNTWGDNLLLNPKLFPAKDDKSRPALWGKDQYDTPSTTITHDLVNDVSVTTITNAHDMPINYSFELDVPKWMRVQFNKQPVVGRAVGYVESSGATYSFITVDGLNESGLYTGSSQPQRLPIGKIGTTIAAIPMSPDTSTIEFNLYVPATCTVHLNDLWLGFGLPSKGLGNVGRAQNVMTGSITKDVDVPGYGHASMYFGQVPAYLHAGTSEVYVGAGQTVEAYVYFDKTMYEQIGGIHTQDDLFQGSIAAIPTVAILTPGVDVADISYCLADMPPDASYVAVKIHNTGAIAATLFVSAIAISVPMKYGNVL